MAAAVHWDADTPYGNDCCSVAVRGYDVAAKALRHAAGNSLSFISFAILVQHIDMTNPATFIEKHGRWTDEQRRQAKEIERRVETDKLQFVRLAWADTHGYSRAKTLTIPAFLSALSDGYNIGVATTTLDSAGGRAFASFTRGGGMGLNEMTGSPNLTIVADPATFRRLPWAPGIGWILCDEYFNDGTPFHFSPRQLLRQALQRLAERGYARVVGTGDRMVPAARRGRASHRDNVGMPGTRGRPIQTLAGRARLSLSFRIQHGPDAAGVRRARRRVRRTPA